MGSKITKNYHLPYHRSVFSLKKPKNTLITIIFTAESSRYSHPILPKCTSEEANLNRPEPSPKSNRKPPGNRRTPQFAVWKCNL